MRSADLPANTLRQRIRDILHGEQVCVPGRADGAELHVRDAARFLARARRLRHLAARRASGVDLHGSDASQAGMAGHVLPVILSWHLGITLSDVAGAAKGALDPKEFWHAWARGEAVTIDLFGPSFDFWAATAEPIDALRSRLGAEHVNRSRRKRVHARLQVHKRVHARRDARTAFTRARDPRRLCPDSGFANPTQNGSVTDPVKPIP